LISSYKAMGMATLSNDAKRVLQISFPKSAFLLTDGAEVKRSSGWRLW
jgi:outer membrane protein assembly factor BamD (BamD/ComL family)